MKKIEDRIDAMFAEEERAAELRRVDHLIAEQPAQRRALRWLLPTGIAVAAVALIAGLVVTNDNDNDNNNDDADRTATVTSSGPDGDEAVRYTGHTGLAASLALLDDGSIASGGRDGLVLIWHPDHPSVTEAVLRGHTSGLTEVVELPDGRIASGDQEGVVRVWRRDGSSPMVFGHHRVRVTALAALDDGRLASVDAEGMVSVWHPDELGALEPGEMVAIEGMALNHAVNDLVQLADGRMASAGSDGVVRLWDPDNVVVPADVVPGDPVYLGHDSSVADLLQLADGRVASAAGQTVHIWNPDALAEAIVVYSGHGQDVTSLVELADGRIASADKDQTRIWHPDNPDVTLSTRPVEPAEGVQRLARDLPVFGALALPDGRIVTSDLGGISVWDADDPATAPVTYDGHTNDVPALIELSDGRVASVAAALRPVGLEAGIIGLPVRIHVWNPEDPSVPGIIYSGHRAGAAVMALGELADGRIVSAGSDGVRIWHPDDPSAETIYAGHSGIIWSLAVLDDGRVATGDATQVQIWDPDNPTLPPSAVIEPTFGEGSDGESTLGFVSEIIELRDGRLAIAAGNTVELFSRDLTESPLAYYSDRATYDRHTGAVRALIELDDGRIASAGQDGSMHVWRPDNLVVPVTMRVTDVIFSGRSGSWVLDLALLDDGRIAYASDKITVVDLTRPGADSVYDLHPARVRSIEQLSSGLIASSSIDGIRIWGPDAEQLSGSTPQFAVRPPPPPAPGSAPFPAPDPPAVPAPPFLPEGPLHLLEMTVIWPFLIEADSSLLDDLFQPLDPAVGAVSACFDSEVRAVLGDEAINGLAVSPIEPGAIRSGFEAVIECAGFDAARNAYIGAIVDSTNLYGRAGAQPKMARDQPCFAAVSGDSEALIEELTLAVTTHWTPPFNDRPLQRCALPFYGQDDLGELCVVDGPQPVEVRALPQDDSPALGSLEPGTCGLLGSVSGAGAIDGWTPITTGPEGDVLAGWVASGQLEAPDALPAPSPSPVPDGPVNAVERSIMTAFNVDEDPPLLDVFDPLDPDRFDTVASCFDLELREAIGDEAVDSFVPIPADPKVARAGFEALVACVGTDAAREMHIGTIVTSTNLYGSANVQPRMTVDEPCFATVPSDRETLITELTVAITTDSGHPFDDRPLRQCSLPFRGQADLGELCVVDGPQPVEVRALPQDDSPALGSLEPGTCGLLGSISGAGAIDGWTPITTGPDDEVLAGWIASGQLAVP